MKKRRWKRHGSYSEIICSVEYEQIYELERRHEENISLLGDELNKKYSVRRGTFTKEFFGRHMFVTIDFIRFLGKENIAERDYVEVETKMNDFLYYAIFCLEYLKLTKLVVGEMFCTNV